MKRSTLRELSFPGAALLAWAACAIACRASFSPDGKKVLFPYMVPLGGDGKEDKAELGVALHDRATGKTTSVRVFEAGQESFASPQWTSDGKRIVLVWLEKRGQDHLEVAVLPASGGAAPRGYVLPRSAEGLSLLNPPPLLEDRHLYLGGDAIHRLDLETGDVKTLKVEDDAYLAARGGKVYAFQELKGTEKGYELATLEEPRGEMRLERAVLLPKDEVGEVAPFLGLSADGARVALAATKGERQEVLVIEGKEVKRRVAADPKEFGLLGNVEWAPDGKTLYAASAQPLSPAVPGGQPSAFDLGLCEVPLGGGAPRVTKLVTFRKPQGKKGDDAPLALTQVSLSPDGKTAAFLGTYLDPGSAVEDDRCLYLVDLADPGRKVTRVRPPAASSGKSAKKE
ncbi:MAG: hypothetical protein HY721_27635 [Planctomycetes bacterium]|nr:hypothetical protein [Planctomycetota bacterium]